MGGKISNQIKKSLHQARHLKTWQLLLILILLLFVTATLLRLDHLQMSSLRAAVLQADESGDEAAIRAALNNLKDFTESHTVVNVVEKNGVEKITFGSGPIYLEHLYQKQAAEALEKAEQELAATSSSNPNGNIFAKAMEVCKPQAIANGWRWTDEAYLNCMTGEISQYPSSDDLQDTYAAQLPSTALYRYDFASPVWTFSLSGLFILLDLIISVVIFIRFLIWCTLRIALIFLKNR